MYVHETFNNKPFVLLINCRLEPMRWHIILGASIQCGQVKYIHTVLLKIVNQLSIIFPQALFNNKCMQGSFVLILRHGICRRSVFLQGHSSLESCSSSEQPTWDQFGLARELLPVNITMETNFALLQTWFLQCILCMPNRS